MADDISASIEQWDGTSANITDDIASHVKTLTDKPAEDKLVQYIGAFDESAQADDPRADHHKPTGSNQASDSC